LKKSFSLASIMRIMYVMFHSNIPFGATRPFHEQEQSSDLLLISLTSFFSLNALYGV